MSKYVCPHCGNDGSMRSFMAPFSKNIIIEAFWEGSFDENGEFETSSDASPDYENSDIYGADEVQGIIEGEGRSLRRSAYHCGACHEDFQEPGKES